MKTNNNNLQKLDKQYIWHPFTQMRDWGREEITIIKKANGVYLEDVNGKRYIDGVSSLWTNIHGHKNRFLNKAIEEQLKDVAHSTFLGLSHPTAIVLAKMLVDISPRGLQRVFYSDSGSEAMEIALKIAFGYWQNKGKKKKNKFVSLSNAYHGDTIGSVSVGGIGLFHKIYKPLLFKTTQAPSPYCYRCKLTSKSKCKWECVKELEKILKKNKNIAGVVVEPLVQGAGGIIVAPKGYLKKVRQLCTRYNTLLIADEVATGFGRTGNMFACEHERVSPDIMAVAKGISGGYLPLAATLTTEKIYKSYLAPYESMKTFFHGHTYTANPLCCAVSIASIDLLHKSGMFKRLKAKISFLRKRLDDFNKLAHVGNIRQCGFIVGIELVKDKKSKKTYDYKKKIGIKVITEAKKRGVIIRPLGDVIVIMPPLSISIKELNKLLDVIYESIKLVTEK